MSKKRDTSIEWMRIIACFLVIGAHIQLSMNVDGSIAFRRLVGSSLLSDNVPLFFLIAGYFLFSRTEEDTSAILKTFGKKTHHVIRNFLLPITILIVIIANIAPYIHGECALADCTFNPASVKHYLYEFFCNQNAYDRAGHFWYICSYLKVFIWFPALALICQKDKSITNLRRLLLVFAYIVIIIQDLENIFGRDFGSYEDMTLGQHALYVVLGYEIYYIFHHTKWQNKKLRYIGLALFAGGLIVKMSLQSYLFDTYGIDTASRHFMGLECGPCYITSVGAFLFWHSFREKFHSRIITFFGKYTLYIYMFHGMVIDRNWEVRNTITTWCNHCSNGFEDLSFYLLFGGYVFLVSFVIGFIFERIYALLLWCFDQMISKIRISLKTKNLSSANDESI